jgi:hypothetical protein
MGDAVAGEDVVWVPAQRSGEPGEIEDEGYSDLSGAASERRLEVQCVRPAGARCRLEERHAGSCGADGARVAASDECARPPAQDGLGGADDDGDVLTEERRIDAHLSEMA